jgi:hypothetical protein
MYRLSATVRRTRFWSGKCHNLAARLSFALLVLKKVGMKLNGTNVLHCICQVSTPELLIKMRNVSKNSLIEAMEASVFFRVVHSVSDIDNLRSDDTSMLYHRSCYKTYTSRRNCGFFKVESAGSDHIPDTSQVPLLNEQTDDTSTDIALCVFWGKQT